LGEVANQVKDPLNTVLIENCAEGLLAYPATPQAPRAVNTASIGGTDNPAHY
jgi:hypothetical protein